MLNITPYKSNQTLVVAETFTALLSYGVPQVIVHHDNSELKGMVMHNSAYYSNTTSKHKNAYLRTLCSESYTCVPASPSEIQEVTGIECLHPEAVTQWMA